MKKGINTALSVCLLVGVSSAQALAASPIPTFDKEAVTSQPYQRTGQQEVVSTDNLKQNQDGEAIPQGNTGTAEDPAFFVKTIELTGFKLEDNQDGELKAILDAYSNRSIRVSELSELTKKITEYARTCGYTVPQAVIPKQEVKDGVLKIAVYVASYDKVAITGNESDVADRVLDKYINYLHSGDVITDKELELAMNNINDLPGVISRVVLSPGAKEGTTNANIEVAKRPVWNNYVFVDNAGGYFSGRYRYGFNTEINNPGHQGDKIILNGMLTSHDVKNYGIRYEAPMGNRGSRIGVAYSQSSYDMVTNSMFGSVGKSRGISVYGLTPIYRDRLNRVTAIYGYDHRDITDELRFKRGFLGMPNIRTDKDADVWHIGISGSQYYPNQFTQYNIIYWYGNINTDGGAYYDGAYHKLTGDVLKIWYDNKFNYRINASMQMASRGLDGSEQFYLGGINGVRAYGASDGYGDSGYLMTGEVRVKTNEPGLEAATFIDWAGGKNRETDTWDHLAGWGLGLRYAKDNDWYAQLDWSRKINARRDTIEPKDHSGRWWFQVYKMF